MAAAVAPAAAAAPTPRATPPDTAIRDLRLPSYPSFQRSCPHRPPTRTVAGPERDGRVQRLHVVRRVVFQRVRNHQLYRARLLTVAVDADRDATVRRQRLQFIRGPRASNSVGFRFAVVEIYGYRQSMAPVFWVQKLQPALAKHAVSLRLLRDDPPTSYRLLRARIRVDRVRLHREHVARLYV